jgi:hypothetical protein
MNPKIKYGRATMALFTPEQLKQADANYAHGAQRFPAEHARAAANIKARGLEHHREVVDWYIKNKMPIPDEALKTIQAFAGSTYAGPFGKGEQREAEATSPGLGNFYHQPVKPEGAE